MKLKLNNNGKSISTNDMQVYYTAVYENRMDYLPQKDRETVQTMLEFIATIANENLKNSFFDAIFEYSNFATILGV